MIQIILANPRGFCAGVDRAIEIVKRALSLFGRPIYVRHEVVHNKMVVNELRQQGVVFVEDVVEIPYASTAIFSAHGVSRLVKKQAQQRKLRIFDATCPLVTKVHMEVARYSHLGQECILIGHVGHPEVEGTLGHYDNEEGGIYLIEGIKDIDTLHIKNPQSLAYVTQTTLSVYDTHAIIKVLRERFPQISAPKKEDICYATQNRQQAVVALAQQCDLVLVLGSINSSNSNRLKESAQRLGKEAYLIESANDIDTRWLYGKSVIGITAGASAPETLVQDLVANLKAIFNAQTCLVSELSGQIEDISFALPRELRSVNGRTESETPVISKKVDA